MEERERAGPAPGILADTPGRAQQDAEAAARLERARLEEAAQAFRALLAETVKDLSAEWASCEEKLEKDPLGRGNRAELPERTKRDLFDEHVRMLR